MGVPLQLKLIDRTDRAANRLNAALGIYRDTILPEAQNPEKQILYWIDHCKDDLVDRFRCFAVQQENKVVGYLQYSYFSEENMFFFEYLCLKEARRTGLQQSECLTTIRDHLAKEYKPGFTIVFEVARIRLQGNDWQSDSKLVRYFSRLGFRTVDFAYRYPVLQTYDGAMSYPADLMIRLPGERTDVTASELRTVLRCIYFKHYLRWDRPFLDPERFAERERLINELYASQVAHIDPTGTFGTRGTRKLPDLAHFREVAPRAGEIAERLFGPKFFRVAAALVLVTVLEHFQTSDWLLIPDMLAGLMLFSAAEDTPEARKMLVALAGKLTAFRPRK